MVGTAGYPPPCHGANGRPQTNFLGAIIAVGLSLVFTGAVIRFVMVRRRG